MSLFRTSTREFVPLHKKQALIFALPGSGKSTLAAGIHKAGHKTIYIDLEKGLEGNFADLPILSPEGPWTWALVEEAVKTAHESNAEVIVVDTWSKAYTICRNHILETKGWATEDDGGTHGKGYGVIRQEFYRVFAPLLSLKDEGRAAFILTHAKERRVEKTAVSKAFTYLDPAIEGPAGKDLEQVFDLQLCYECEKKSTGDAHVLYTKNDGYHTAKDRTGILPPRIVFPAVTGTNDEVAAATWQHFADVYEKGAKGA